MKKIKLSRQELYEMVWKEPLTTISKRFHLTYNDLRKIYSDLNIPIPEGGYWSKLRWGKLIKVKELPHDYTGTNKVELTAKEPGDPETSNIYNCNNEDQNDETIFKVPDRLTNPDILVTKAKVYFEANKGRFWGNNKRFLEGTDILWKSR